MTPAQLALLRVAKKQLAMSEEDYRALLSQYGYVESAKDLSREGFAAVMEEFNRRGFESTSRHQAQGRLGFMMATEGQRAHILKCWGLVTGGSGTPQTLDKWISNRFHVSALRFLDPTKARQVIGALHSWCTKRGLDIPRSGD
jgi:hypothetical protein